MTPLGVTTVPLSWRDLWRLLWGGRLQVVLQVRGKATTSVQQVKRRLVLDAGVVPRRHL